MKTKRTIKFTILLFILLTLFNIHSFSQVRIGYTEYQIMHQEYPDKNFRSGLSKSGTKYILYEDNEVITYYYLNNTRVCYMCFIAVKNESVLNAYIQDFNKSYIPVSDTEWKLYTDSGVILKCELKTLSGASCFIFSKIGKY